MIFLEILVTDRYELTTVVGSSAGLRIACDTTTPKNIFFAQHHTLNIRFERLIVLDCYSFCKIFRRFYVTIIVLLTPFGMLCCLNQLIENIELHAFRMLRKMLEAFVALPVKPMKALINPFFHGEIISI